MATQGATQPTPPNPQTGPQTSWSNRGGYRDLAWFMNASPGQNCNLARRFDQLNTRCLLYLQDELSEMETALARMDQSGYDSSSRRRDAHPHRPALIALIQEKIQTYNNLLLQRAQLLQLLPATAYQYRIFDYWIEGKQPLVREELASLRHPDDMVALGGPERDWLYKALEEQDWPIFTSEKQRNIAPDQPYLHYSSQTRIRRAARGIVLLGTLAFLLGPVLTLSYIETKSGRLAVVCVSISGFGLLVTIMTKARSFEIAAAIAAYGAVVVVFLGAT